MMTHTGWRRLIGCLELQVISRKRATKYAALLRKITYKHEASYGSSPPCMSWLIKSTEINGCDDSYEIVSWLIGGDLMTHMRWFHHSVPAHEYSNDRHMCTWSPWHLSRTIQHTATHCSTLPHAATHCNTLQHTAAHYNTLQHTTTHCSTLQHSATHFDALQH